MDSTALGSTIYNSYFRKGKGEGQAMQQKWNYGWEVVEHGKRQLVKFRSDLTESAYDVVDSIECDYDDVDNSWEVLEKEEFDAAF